MPLTGNMLIETSFGLYLMGYAIGLANVFKPADSPRWLRAAIPMVALGSCWMVANVVMGLLPVLREQTATVEVNRPGTVVMSIYADKVRDCRWLSTDAYVMNAEGEKREAGLVFEKDRIIGNSRPLGWQWFGFWRLEFEPDFKPTSVEFHAWHSCGWLWQRTHTVSGPFWLPGPVEPK